MPASGLPPACLWPASGLPPVLSLKVSYFETVSGLGRVAKSRNDCHTDTRAREEGEELIAADVMARPLDVAISP